MGMTLANLATSLGEPQVMTKAAILDVIRWSRILNFLPFENVNKLILEVEKVQRLPDAGGFRKFNGAYNEGGAAETYKVFEALKMFGEDFTVDRWTPKEEVQKQIQMKLKSYSLAFNDQFINGDSAVNADAWDGLRKKVTAMQARQTLWFAASNAAGLDATANAVSARKFFATLTRGVRRCNGGKCDLIVANEAFIDGLTRSAMLLQASGNYLNTTRDALDRKITTWNDIPIVDIGLKKDQSTEIITSTEVGGDSTANTTSVYFMSFDMLDGIYGAQMEPFRFYDPLNGAEMETKPAKMYRVDWPHTVVSFGNFGIVRARNLKAPDSWTE
jgi:hypothetical protein